MEYERANTKDSAETESAELDNISTSMASNSINSESPAVPTQDGQSLLNVKLLDGTNKTMKCDFDKT